MDPGFGMKSSNMNHSPVGVQLFWLTTGSQHKPAVQD